MSVVRRMLKVLKHIHSLDVTHGDLHAGNALFSRKDLFGKTEAEVEKKLVEDGDVSITPFIIYFGQSMSFGPSTRTNHVFKKLVNKDLDKVMDIMWKVFFWSTPAAYVLGV